MHYYVNENLIWLILIAIIFVIAIASHSKYTRTKVTTIVSWIKTRLSVLLIEYALKKLLDKNFIDSYCSRWLPNHMLLKIEYKLLGKELYIHHITEIIEMADNMWDDIDDLDEDVMIEEVDCEPEPEKPLTREELRAKLRSKISGKSKARERGNTAAVMNDALSKVPFDILGGTSDEGEIMKQFLSGCDRKTSRKVIKMLNDKKSKDALASGSMA